ncbi:ABC transporter ATP-binding protein [Methanoplanus endosymbiosus]|uniref:ABC transporter ATP-binding protein/permease n=1 Tax=Methanoplanus endosymbiosus TaxID=33865 RepID=A0A9E7TIX8_9EURY|nr:ABC transporter ATP-binding protein [Methanoplanus endosymbiosus]UUX91170.1 ABC transporter ATP-binding protein/permease [Methanoplanus endosymbiosus]
MTPASGDTLTLPKEPEGAGRIKSLIRVSRYLGLKKIRLAAVIILFLIGTVSFILLSVMLGIAVNSLTGIKTVDTIYPVVATMAGLSVLSFICYYIGYYLLADVIQTALFRLRQNLFEHMQTLSLRFYDRQPIGELMSRVTNDIDVVTAFFQVPLGTLLMGTFMLITTMVAMLWLNSWLALVAMVAVVLLIGIVWLLARVAGPAFGMLQERLADLNGLTEETLAGEKTIIAYRQQKKMAARQSGVSKEAYEVGVKAQVVSLVINPLTVLVTNLDVGIVALIGSIMIVKGALTVGVLTTFLSLTLLFVLPMLTIFANYNYILSASVSAGRIFSILDEKPDIVDRPGAVELKPVKGHVVFKDVNFSYVSGRQILKNNSFEALPGQKIGLCGPTGAGKSTIINILTRYYDIDSGIIEIDGQNIYDVKQESLRKQIGVVLQEPFLFSDTVMNNLKYGRDGASEDECTAVAKDANCHEFITRLPKGYDTILSDGGSNLSQGQRQLLTIARAMIADPRILILDEATSNVDTRTEKNIQAALRKLQEGRTSFVIAHRLSTIKDAHKILVINQGEIVERGTHDEMMAAKGFYYDLYMSQFKGRVSEILSE